MMRPRRILIALALCVQVAATGAGEVRVVEPPEAAPVLALRTLDGSPRDIATLRGKVVLVNFWATWCLPCMEEMPALDRLRLDLEAHPFEVLAVNVSEPVRRVKRFYGQLGLGLTVVRDPDGQAFARWGGRVYPTTLLLDREGRVRYRVLGPVDWDGDDARAAVFSLLGDSPSE